MFNWLKRTEKREQTKNIVVNDSFSKIREYIDSGKNIFITGGAGTGKSYTLNRLKEIYKDELVVTSTTGISALNVNGQTLHSWAGIGIANKPIEFIVKKIKNNPILFKQLILCKKLAIDEISMLDNKTFEYVDRVLQRVRENDLPFGGIQIILIGDFFQLPPVKAEDTDKDFCFNSDTWSDLNLITILLKNVKRQTDPKFVEALNNVRIDKTSVEDLKVFYECDKPANYEVEKDVLRIFGTNTDADNYNQKCFDEIESAPYLYETFDNLYQYSLIDDNCTIIKMDDEGKKKISEKDLYCLKQFDRDCKAPLKLELKEGCRVMLLKNLNIKQGLVNGSCGTVKMLTSASVDVLFDNGVRLNLTPVDFEYTQEGRTKIIRKQYPLRLAYGITIHKSQGMTFDKLVVNFNKIFDYGQAYVALSRTRSLEGLIIKGFDHNKIRANEKVIDFYKKLEENQNCKIFD